MTSLEILQQRISSGIAEYEKAVLEMSDEELRSHCFDDGDSSEEHFCVKEFRRREKIAKIKEAVKIFCDWSELGKVENLPEKLTEKISNK